MLLLKLVFLLDLRSIYAPLWLIIAPLIIFTWNDSQLLHNFSSVFCNYMCFGTTCAFYLKVFSSMLYNLGEDYKVGHDFAL